MTTHMNSQAGAAPQNRGDAMSEEAREEFQNLQEDAKRKISDRKYDADEEIQNEQRETDDRIQQLRQDTDDMIDQRKQDADDRINQRKQDADDEIEQAERDADDEAEATERDYDDKIEQAEWDADDEAEQTERDYDDGIEQIERDADDEADWIMRDRDDRISDLEMKKLSAEDEDSETALDDEIQRIQDESDDEIQNLKDAAERKAEELRAQKKNALQRIQNKKEKKTERLKAEKEDKIRHIQANKEEQIQRIQGDADQEIEKIQQESDQEIQSILQNSEDEIQRIKQASELRVKRMREAAKQDCESIQKEFDERAQKIKAAQAQCKQTGDREQYKQLKHFEKLNNYYSENYQSTLSFGAKCKRFFQKFLGVGLLIAAYFFLVSDLLKRMELLFQWFGNRSQLVPFISNELLAVLAIIVLWKIAEAISKSSKIKNKRMLRFVTVLTNFITENIFVLVVVFGLASFVSQVPSDLSFSTLAKSSSLYGILLCGIVGAGYSVSQFEKCLFGIQLHKVQKVTGKKFSKKKRFVAHIKNSISNAFGQKISTKKAFYVVLYPIAFTIVTVAVISPIGTQNSQILPIAACLAITGPKLAWEILDKLLIPRNIKAAQIIELAADVFLPNLPSLPKIK